MVFRGACDFAGGCLLSVAEENGVQSFKLMMKVNSIQEEVSYVVYTQFLLQSL